MTFTMKQVVWAESESQVSILKTEQNIASFVILMYLVGLDFVLIGISCPYTSREREREREREGGGEWPTDWHTVRKG